MRIGGTTIGADTVFVIAEAGINHNGDLARALEMVDVAAKAGADAVKFQTFQTDKLVTASAAKASYQSAQTGGGSQRDMLKALELTPDDHRQLMQRCAEKKILFLSTPFEEDSADFLDALGVVAFKIPSGELTNLPFLRHVAMKKKPMIVSTGMADMDEVGAALDTIERAGNPDIVVLHCVSQYPADPSEANLRAMTTMRDTFGYQVGFSDHTLGWAVAAAAAALGAVVIEKHFTLDRTLPGPDHQASMEPLDLKAMISDIRIVSSALGDGIKRAQPGEGNTAEVARKSIVTVVDIVAGARIESHQLAVRRPGTGIAPAFMDQVVGRCAARALPSDTVVQWGDLA
jgi:N,N'-diacetyllegionaminate synthase